MATVVIFPLLLSFLWASVYPLSLPTSDCIQQCRFLSSCKDRQENGSGIHCRNSGECSCSSRACRRIDGSCAHACNQSDVAACMTCLGTAECTLCSTQCANVCLDPHCEYPQNKTVCPSCVLGYYGDNCNESCSSVCKGSCFEETGYCRICENNTHGRECEETCPDSCHACSSQNGSCLKCVDGYTGRECNVACPGGFYGAGCDTKCPENCEGNNCDPKTGYCNGGCRPGFFGRHCLKKCPDGTYGPGCIAECPVTCFSNRTCYHVNGSCLYGCKEGFQGEHCNVLCSLGKYGENCSQNCSQNCFFGLCNGFSGYCHTCVQGRDGPYCDQVMDVQSMKAPAGEEPVSIQETTLIFLALFSVGAGTWMLMGACIYYKQTMIRDKILRTGKLPRSWHSVINRHPQYFIYSGLRRRSSFLWRPPNHSWGMRARRQRSRVRRRVAQRLRQKNVNVRTGELQKKRGGSMAEMTLLNEQCIDEITNSSNNVITRGGTDHTTAGKYEKEVEEQVIKERRFKECEQTNDEGCVIWSDSKVKGTDLSNESQKLRFKDKGGNKINSDETECSEATEKTTAMSMNDYDKDFTEKIGGEKQDIHHIPLDRTEGTGGSVAIDLEMFAGRHQGERSLTEAAGEQTNFIDAAETMNKYLVVGNEEKWLPNTVDTGNTRPNKEYGGNTHPNTADGGKTHPNTADRGNIYAKTTDGGKTTINTAHITISQRISGGLNRPEDISYEEKRPINMAGSGNSLSNAVYLENTHLNRALALKCRSDITQAQENTTCAECAARKRLTELARGEPSCSDIKLKEKWSTFAEQDEMRSSAHEFSKSTNRTAASSACTSCGKQCLCSVLECQGSTVTGASEQGDSFVPVLENGKVFQNVDTFGRHRRSVVPYSGGPYAGSSLSRVETIEEFPKETGKVQDRNTIHLLRPTTRSKSLRYQGASNSKRIHRTQKHSSENVQEVTSTTFHTEVESSEATGSMSGNSTARSSKRRLGSSSAVVTYSSHSGSDSSTVVSSSALSMTETSSVDISIKKVQLSRSRQQYFKLALERQSQPSQAKTDTQRNYTSFGARNIHGDNKDVENTAYFRRFSPQQNIFQRGYKTVVNAVTKLLTPGRLRRDECNHRADKDIPFSPQRPSSSEFIISRLEDWQRSRGVRRGTGATSRETAANMRQTKSSTTFEKSTLNRTVESVGESSSSMTKEGSSLTGHSDVSVSKSASSRPVSASTFSRRTRFSASAGISTTSRTSHNSTSAGNPSLALDMKRWQLKETIPGQMLTACRMWLGARLAIHALTCPSTA